MKKGEKTDIITPEIKLEVDIMNRNTIIGLSMMYALWDSKRKDLLAVITPFVLYCVGTTTSVGSKIDTGVVSKKMEEEFGYKHFLPGVVNRTLSRLTNDSTKTPVITRKQRYYYLSQSLDESMRSFAEKRIVCKERTEKLIAALVDYLNEKEAYGRNNYAAPEAEKYLLAFFEKRGESILLSIEDLRQLIKCENEIDYYIGRFILAEVEKHSSLVDHINELIAGYYITTAIYLQPDNSDINNASFKNVTFYLDTPILLSLLGYKSSVENQSTQAMVDSLRKSGANLACFSYNIEEIDSILTAYCNSIICRNTRPSSITLEFFDENHYTETQVRAEKDIFEHRLEVLGILPIPFSEAPVNADGSGLLNDNRIREILVEINPRYNVSTLPDDIQAINTISRIRRGKTIDRIEKCKAVFATTNIPLVIATKKFFGEVSHNPGFPIAISADELCVMAWLKDFEKDSKLPKMRLMENVLAATSPSKDLLDTYFAYVDQLETLGEITIDEAAYLRVNQYARNEMMDLTGGSKNELSLNAVREVKVRTIDQIKEAGFIEGQNAGYQRANEEWQKELCTRKNAGCRQIENEVTTEYAAKNKRTLFLCKLGSVALAGILIVGLIITIINYFSKESSTSVFLPLALAIASAVQTWQACLPLFKKDNYIMKKTKKHFTTAAEQEIDKRKKQYLSTFENTGNIDK